MLTNPTYRVIHAHKPKYQAVHRYMLTKPTYWAVHEYWAHKPNILGCTKLHAHKHNVLCNTCSQTQVSGSTQIRTCSQTQDPRERSKYTQTTENEASSYTQTTENKASICTPKTQTPDNTTGTHKPQRTQVHTFVKGVYIISIMPEVITLHLYHNYYHKNLHQCC